MKMKWSNKILMMLIINKFSKRLSDYYLNNDLKDSEIISLVQEKNVTERSWKELNSQTAKSRSYILLTKLWYHVWL